MPHESMAAGRFGSIVAEVNVGDPGTIINEGTVNDLQIGRFAQIIGLRRSDGRVTATRMWIWPTEKYTASNIKQTAVIAANNKRPPAILGKRRGCFEGSLSATFFKTTLKGCIMRPCLFLVLSIMLFGLSLQCCYGQQDVAFWIPLQVGNRWIYAHESKSGDTRRPKVIPWITEERVTGLVSIPDGLVILRDVREQDPSRGEHLGYLAEHGNWHYLVHGDCIYFLDKSGYGLNGREPSWDELGQQLNPVYRVALDRGTIAPDICFPLEAGKSWGTRDLPWRVQGIGNEGSSLPTRVPGDAFHIVSDHFGSGGKMDVWFQKGVGIVIERYLHNGTYEEYTKTLRQFVPTTR